MTNLIPLTEIVKDGDDTKTQPMLLPAEFIGKVTTGKLERSGPVIIGQTEEKTLTLVMLKNNVPIFVEETLEDIKKLVDDANLAEASLGK